MSVLDVLLAMSHYSRHGDGGNMCRPHFVQLDSETQVDKLRDISHLCSTLYQKLSYYAMSIDVLWHNFWKLHLTRFAHRSF